MAEGTAEYTLGYLACHDQVTFVLTVRLGVGVSNPTIHTKIHHRFSGDKIKLVPEYLTTLVSVLVLINPTLSCLVVRQSIDPEYATKMQDHKRILRIPQAVAAALTRDSGGAAVLRSIGSIFLPKPCSFACSTIRILGLK